MKSLTKEEITERFGSLTKAWSDRREAVAGGNSLAQTIAEEKIRSIQMELRDAGVKAKDGSAIEVIDFSKPYSGSKTSTSGTVRPQFKSFGKKELTSEEISTRTETFLSAVIPIAKKHATTISTNPQDVQIITQALTKAVAIYLQR
jgi:D-mannonate dehydratase